MKKKEILIIFALAVLMTGGSWFAQGTKETYFETSQRWDTCIYRGSPMGYYGCWAISGAGYSNLAIEPFFLILDFLFWSLVIFGVWRGVKWMKRRVTGKSKMNQNMNLSKIFQNEISTPMVIGLVVVITLLAGGVLVWQYSRPTEQITITTDKTEYEQGEKITATLNYEGEIYRWDGLAWSIQRWEKGSWNAIQRKADLFCSNISVCGSINFQKIEECPLSALCEAPCWEQVRSTEKLIWDQSYKVEEKTFQCKFIQRPPGGKVISEKMVDRACAVFEQVPSGKYKLRFEYKSTLDPNNRCSRNADIKYAEKEFMIREK